MGNYCFMGTVSVWDDKKVLAMDSGDGCTLLQIYLMALNCVSTNS